MLIAAHVVNENKIKQQVTTVEKLPEAVMLLHFQRLNPLLTNMEIRRQNNVTSSNKYIAFTSMEYVYLKHFLVILYKSKHFPVRYRRKRVLFFSEHSVQAD